MQGIHFTYAIGLVAGPLLAEAFAASALTHEDWHLSNSTWNISLQASDNTSQLTSVETTSIATTPEEADDTFTGVYFVNAAILFFCAVGCFAVMFTQERYIRIYVDDDDEDLKKEKTNCVNKYVLFLVPMMSLFHIFHLGLMIGYQGMLVAFVVKRLGFSRTEAPLVLSVYYVAFIVGRGLGIVVSRHVTSAGMLFGNLGIILCGLLLEMFVSPVWSSVVWISSPLIGLGMSTVFPASLIWFETQIPMDGKIASVVMIVGSLGVMGIPPLVGNLLDQRETSSFDFVFVAADVLAILLFAIMYGVAKRRRKRGIDTLHVDSFNDMDKFGRDRASSACSGLSIGSGCSFRHFSVSRLPSVFSNGSAQLRRSSCRRCSDVTTTNMARLAVPQLRHVVAASLVNTPMNMHGQTPLAIYRLLG